MSNNSVSNIILSAANVAANRTPEENGFQHILQRTRALFRPDTSQVTSTPSTSSITYKRGRRRKEFFKKKVFLMKLAHSDFLPGATEQAYLKRRSLGEAVGLLSINRNWSLNKIKNHIYDLYPPHIADLLRMSGFSLAKCDRQKKLCLLNGVNTGLELEDEIGKGLLIIIPKRNFPGDLPVTTSTTNQSDSDFEDIPMSHRSLRSNVRRVQSENSLSESIFTVDDNWNQNENGSAFQPEETWESIDSSANTSPVTQEISSAPMNFDFDEAPVVDEGQIGNPSVLSLPILKEDADVLSIEISRSNCVFEMFKIYSDQSVVNKKLNVTFRDELGIDGGGLTKELFNIFFKEIENKYFRGEDCLVPFLELNKIKEKDNYVIIGRILEHMLLLTSTIPSKLSKIMLMLVSNPEKQFEETELLDELFAYVNPCLRYVLKNGVHDFGTLKTKEIEILQDFFQSYRFFELPSAQKFKEQLLLIATEIVIETPRRLIDSLRKGIRVQKYEFWKKCDFGTLLDMQKPTPNKVANCIVTEGELTNDENRILHYLEMYIRCLSPENVSLFVFMITGSFMMPLSIKLKFSDLTGLSQRPVFSTCTDTLFLPRSYPTYQDLKNDINICLQSEEAKMYSSY